MGTRTHSTRIAHVVLASSLLLLLALLLAACGEDDTADDAADDAADDSSDDTSDDTEEDTADAVAEFYEGRTVTFLVGFSEGGGYDQYARLTADHWGRHIPGNPDIIVENQDGARSVVAMNRAYLQGPQDGSLIVFPHRAVYQFQLTQQEGVQYELLEMPPIGNPVIDSSLCAVHSRTGVETFEEAFDTEVTIGASTPGEEVLLAQELGVLFRGVHGYEDGDATMLAIEQGEVDGRCGWGITRMLTDPPEVVDNMNILVETSAEPHPLAPTGVPNIMEYAEDDETTALFEFIFGAGVIGRPVFVPPEVPEEIVQALRESYVAMLEDPEFLADAESRNLEVFPVSAERLEELIDGFFGAPPEVIERAAESIGG